MGGGCTFGGRPRFGTGDDECPATSFSFLPLPGGRPRLRGTTTLASSSSSCVMPSSKPTYTFLVLRSARPLDGCSGIHFSRNRAMAAQARDWVGFLHHILRSNAESYSNVCGSFFDVTSLLAPHERLPRLRGRGSDPPSGMFTPIA